MPGHAHHGCAAQLASQRACERGIAEREHATILADQPIALTRWAGRSANNRCGQPDSQLSRRSIESNLAAK
jgi:hypothetical protein